MLAGDTADTLAARVLQQEHVIYPQAVQWFINDQLQLAEGLVKAPGNQLLMLHGID